MSLQKGLEEAVKKAEQALLLKQRDERIELLIKVNSAVFDKAIAYVNVLMLSGYAGAFALLATTKDLLNVTVLVSAALLLTFSLIVFCAWELTKMIINGKTFLRLVPLLQETNTPEEFFKKLNDYQIHSGRISLFISRWWMAVLIMSVLPGFAAGLLLLLNYVFILLN